MNPEQPDLLARMKSGADMTAAMSPEGQARQVREILDRYPALTEEGHGLSNLTRRTPEEHAAELARQHELLAAPESVAEISAAADWIAEHWERRKTVNWQHTSYGLKHIYEAATGVYITNGQFIVAMLLAGFEAPMRDGLNPRFAISERPVTETWRRFMNRPRGGGPS